MFTKVTGEAFGAMVETAMASDARIDAMLSHGVDYSAHECYATADGTAGFAVSPDGDLQSVFNYGTGGRGDALVTAAIGAGARTLDCFDGFLPAFYARHGFRVVRREANWTVGGPDVVYMAR
jgi:hypothetical protein